MPDIGPILDRLGPAAPWAAVVVLLLGAASVAARFIWQPLQQQRLAAAEHKAKMSREWQQIALEQIKARVELQALVGGRLRDEIDEFFVEMLQRNVGPEVSTQFRLGQGSPAEGAGVSGARSDAAATITCSLCGRTQPGSRSFCESCGSYLRWAEEEQGGAAPVERPPERPRAAPRAPQTGASSPPPLGAAPRAPRTGASSPPHQDDRADQLAATIARLKDVQRRHLEAAEALEKTESLANVDHARLAQLHDALAHADQDLADTMTEVDRLKDMLPASS